MIGQDKLLNEINSFNIDTFPKTSIISGERGCGKHSLIKIISQHLGLETKELLNITEPGLEEILTSPIPYLYLIDGDSLTIKNQNTLLKTLEEPLNNSFLILITEDESHFIDTILQRCYLFRFDFYEDNTLKQFVLPKYADHPSLLNILRTPGKLTEINNIDFNKHYEFSLKMLSKIKIASLANALTIVDKFNYKEDYNKLDISLMMGILRYVSYEDYMVNSNKDSLIFFEVTLKYYNLLKNKIYDKKQLITNYIINLWRSIKGV